MTSSHGKRSSSKASVSASSLPSPKGVSTYFCCIFKISGEGILSLQLSPYWRHYSILDYGSALFTRPLLLVAILLISNYFGHFHPLFWSDSHRPALLSPALLRLPAVRMALNASQPLIRPFLPYLRHPLPLDYDDFAHADSSALDSHAFTWLGHSVTSKAAASSLTQTGRRDIPSQQQHPGPGVTASSALTVISDEESSGGGGLTDQLEKDGDVAGEGGTAAAQAAAMALAPEEAAAVQEIVGSGDSSTDNSGNGGSSGHGGSGTVAGVSATAGFSPHASCYSSPYTQCWRISVSNQPACRKIYPRHLEWPSHGPITFVGDLLRKHQRLLLIFPRHGLGNSLRGYVSSFVYASVSGRRLVRFHGAEHAKVFDTLCHSFQCGFDGIEPGENLGGSMGLYKQLELLNPVDLNSKYKVSARVLSSLRSTHQLFVSKSPHFFDGFWRNFPQVQNCVYAAFGCSSTWCVRSRAIHALVGSPTPLLRDVIQKVLRRHVASGQPDIPAKRDTERQMFDIALHFRTRPAAIESKNPGEKEARTELIRIGCGQDQDVGAASQFLKSCLWACLGGVLQQLQLQKLKEKGQGLDILLATDNELLRPAFVDRLAPFGTVFYSSGVIVHSSKSASEEAERLPTMAEFHLMSRSHMILEAGSYISTFAYFSGLLGNGTLAGISWLPGGKCALNKVHRGVLVRNGTATM